MFDDLNAKEVMNYGDGTPFLPWQNGHYSALFVGLFHKTGFRGAAWLAKFAILESNQPNVVVNQTYCVRIPIGEAGPKGQIGASKLRMILAALEDRNPADATFDANAARDKWRGMGEAAIAAGALVDIVGNTRTTKEGKEITDFYFRKGALPVTGGAQ